MLGWLDEDEAKNFPARQRDLRVIGNLREGRLYVFVRRRDLGLLRGGDTTGNGCRFSDSREEHLQLYERRVGKLRFVDVRTMFRDGKAFGSGSGEATDLSCQCEFDGVDDAALSRSVGT